MHTVSVQGEKVSRRINCQFLEPFGLLPKIRHCEEICLSLVASHGIRSINSEPWVFVLLFCAGRQTAQCRFDEASLLMTRTAFGGSPALFGSPGPVVGRGSRPLKKCGRYSSCSSECHPSKILASTSQLIHKTRKASAPIGLGNHNVRNFYLFSQLLRPLCPRESVLVGRRRQPRLQPATTMRWMLTHHKPNPHHQSRRGCLATMLCGQMTKYPLYLKA